MNLTKHWAAQLDDYVIDLEWSPAGDLLAAASAAGPVSLFSSGNGASSRVLAGHGVGTNAMAWHPGAPILATGGQDGCVKFWDPVEGQHLSTLSLGNTWVEHLAWRPRHDSTDTSEAVVPCLAVAAGRKLSILSSDGTLSRALRDAPKTLSALAWHPEGACLAAAHFGGITLWDTDDGIAQKEFPYANGIHALTWSPDGKWLVSGNQDPSMHLWIPELDQEFHMSGYETKVKQLSFDRSSRWLATGGGRDACIWDCSGSGPEGREPQMYPHDAPVCAVSFQHSHSLLATASQDGTVMLWSPDRKQPLRATVRMPSAATKLTWSPNDHLLAIGSEKGVVYVLRCEE
jgi:WD40 repeat protein